MQKSRLFPTLGIVLFSLLSIISVLFYSPIEASENPGPFDPPDIGIPDGYLGFDGSNNFPSDITPPGDGFPWTNYLDGENITVDTAETYIEIVKDYIADDMIALLADPRTIEDGGGWNPEERGWYNEIWLSSLRDGIHGAYVGSRCFSPDLFPESGLEEPFTTYVLVFYNDIAAQTLQRVWGDEGLSPNIFDDEAQFDEGSIIVKAAFATATEETWEPMTGALSWDIYTTPYDCATGEKSDTPEIFSVNFFQFDIIVKDSFAAPETTWVFSTIVYDNDIEATDDPAGTWDQMPLLGVMWGNDPDATQPEDELQENWINPEAPIYSTETLGWNGRLSGPNDGAQQLGPYYLCSGDGCIPDDNGAFCRDDTCEFVDSDGPILAMSSCMSCHSTAQYEMDSFLLPVPLMPPTNTGGPVPATFGSDEDAGLVFYEPGSEMWMTWFQDRPGFLPKDAGSSDVIASADYDLNLPFKTLPNWATEICLNEGNPYDDPVCSILNGDAVYWVDMDAPSIETDYRGFVIETGD